MTTATASLPAIGTTAQVVVTDPDMLPLAERTLRHRLDDLDHACSRFRADSELSRLHERAGSPVRVGPLLFAALEVALDAAARTDGLVDPTVGGPLRDLGYDRDFAAIDPDGPAVHAQPAPGWWRVRLDPAARTVVVPRGVRLDLGATAKAFAADRIAAELAATLRCGVMVNLGGDLAVAGPPPGGGWRVTLVDGGQTVAVQAGGLATSSTTRRTWRRGGRQLHHIVDPSTGMTPEPLWRTVNVTAPSCVAANTAATAAIVLGASAPDWLRLPARLVAEDGAATRVNGWP